MLPEGESLAGQPVARSQPIEPVLPVVAAKPAPEPVPVPVFEPEPEVVTAVVEDFLDIDASALDDLFGDTEFSDASLAVDDFWDEAMTDHDSPKTRGLSFEEARKQGLFPTDIEANDLPE